LAGVFAMQIIITSLAVAGALLLTEACENSQAATPSDATVLQKMDEKDSLNLAVGETHQITLQSRGASGLQLLYRCQPESIVQIRRLEQKPSDSAKPPADVGSGIPATFEIKALKQGVVKVTFYETRPWDKNFKEIVQREMSISVSDSGQHKH
jgi:predicted secreted protein